MQDIRQLAIYSQYWKKVKGVNTLIDRIDIDEDKIDIYDIATQEDLDNLRGYQPKQKIKDFDEVSICYLDIETYSNNTMVVNHFINALKYAKFYKSDRQLINYICRDMRINSDILTDGHKQYLIDRCDREVRHGEISTPALDLLRDEILGYILDNKDRLISIDKDIDEKAALYPHKAVIALIGLMNEKGRNIIINCLEDEGKGIQRFFKILSDKNPEILAHFNGFSFDLPFIITRCNQLNIEHTFYISPHYKVHRTALRNSKPQTYRDIWYNHGKTAIIDLYNQLLSWDNVARKMVKYDLKSAPIAIGLRKDERLNLSYEEMKQSIENDDAKKLEEYLIFDLEDSKLLGDFLLPAIYYQLEWLPTWKLQSLSSGGMGSKWNDFLIESYKDFGFTESPKPSVKYEFEGGLTGAFCGLYENVSKVDVESEYPHAMLLKLIASEKDSKKLILACLLYCLEYRLSLKKIAKQFKGEIKGTKADQRQGSEKIKINSSYGSFGTPNKEYNDYLAGACVTATGRALLKLIIRELIKRGAKIASYDTDGVFYTCGSFERNKEVWREINEILPGTGNIRFKLDYELEAKTFYVPPASGWVSDSEDEELEESKKAIFDREITGKKKNYIIIDNDGVMKCKGKFNKRDRSVLENTFTPKLVYEYHLGGIEASKKYYEETRKNLESRQYDPILLKVTRKIKDTEKRTVELGLGEHGDVVTIWKQKDLPKFGKKGQILKDTIVMWTDKPEHIDYNHYLDIIDEEYKEFISLLEGTKNHV